MSVAVSQPPLPPPLPTPVDEPEWVLDLKAAEEMADPAHGGTNGHANGASDEAARATQDRALEALEAQFADLVHRVDQLGSGSDRS